MAIKKAKTTQKLTTKATTTKPRTTTKPKAPSTVRMSLRIGKDLHNKIKQFLIKNKLSISQIAIPAIEKYLQENLKTKAKLA